MVSFRAYVYRPLDGEWLYYNFAAGSFHTRKFCIVDFMRLKLNFIQKTKQKIAFQPSFGDVGVTYALHL